MITRQLVLGIAASGFLSAAETWLDQYEVKDITSGFSTTRANQSISNKPLTVAGTVYQRGVGTHAASPSRRAARLA